MAAPRPGIERLSGLAHVIAKLEAERARAALERVAQGKAAPFVRAAMRAPADPVDAAAGLLAELIERELEDD